MPVPVPGPVPVPVPVGPVVSLCVPICGGRVGIPTSSLNFHDGMHEPPTQMPSAALLWDYVPWEQMSKQRRGIMWALQLAHTLRDRTLVLPPVRFHTAEKGIFETRSYSDLFELAPLSTVHPVEDLETFLRQSAGHVDLTYTVLKGLPKESSPGPAHRAADGREWVPGECVDRPKQECVIDSQGEKQCVTVLASFASIAGGVRVFNHSCGWAPSLRWDRILSQRNVLAVPSVAIQGIVLQIPPPASVAELSAKWQLPTVPGQAAIASCGWSCPYAHTRGAMVYRTEFVDVARAFLAQARERYGRAVDGDADASPVRVLAVHWRRGDFLQRSGRTERVCVDESTGERLMAPSGKPCIMRAVLLSASQLAAEVRARLAEHGAAVVFLASNAQADEVEALRSALRGVPLVRWEATDMALRPPPTMGASATNEQLDSAAGARVEGRTDERTEQPNEQPIDQHVAPRNESSDGAVLTRAPSATTLHWGAPELAVIDTLICALADAFLGTPRSMFSWNILEERVLQGRATTTGAMMGMKSG